MGSEGDNYDHRMPSYGPEVTDGLPEIRDENEENDEGEVRFYNAYSDSADLQSPVEEMDSYPLGHPRSPIREELPCRDEKKMDTKHAYNANVVDPANGFVTVQHNLSQESGLIPNSPIKHANHCHYQQHQRPDRHPDHHGSPQCQQSPQREPRHREPNFCSRQRSPTSYRQFSPGEVEPKNMPIDEAYRVEDNEKNLQSPLQKEQERQIVRKLDKHLLPLLGILYLFSYLDRVNIGNARLYGLEEAIHLSHGQYNM
ncbi:hypothetical protein BGW41_000557 [Actinomortierella wolfii]|nr:hypothetical protein BGW41_000557 [Actinomortierella wolfii]